MSTTNNVGKSPKKVSFEFSRRTSFSELCCTKLEFFASLWDFLSDFQTLCDPWIQAWLDEKLSIPDSYSYLLTWVSIGSQVNDHGPRLFKGGSSRRFLWQFTALTLNMMMVSELPTNSTNYYNVCVYVWGGSYYSNPRWSQRLKPIKKLT